MKTGIVVEPAAHTVLKSSNTESKLSIWLVDDKAFYCQHLMWSLEREPCVKFSRHFACAASLLAALHHEAPPNAILVDVQMPVMNGIEAIRPIKLLAPSTIVLIITTFFDHRMKEQALAAGAAAFLLKRDSPAQIIAAVRSASAQFNVPDLTHIFPPQ
jgi:DNA-binding NarL/FixJ family response regulator